VVRRLRVQYILRLLMQSYLEIAVSAFIQMNDLSFEGFANYFGSALAIIFLITISLLPVIVFVYMKLNHTDIVLFEE